jgi:hypothetical protein
MSTSAPGSDRWRRRQRPTSFDREAEAFPRARPYSAGPVVSRRDRNRRAYEPDAATLPLWPNAQWVHPRPKKIVIAAFLPPFDKHHNSLEKCPNPHWAGDHHMACPSLIPPDVAAQRVRAASRSPLRARGGARRVSLMHLTKVALGETARLRGYGWLERAAVRMRPGVLIGQILDKTFGRATSLSHI